MNCPVCDERLRTVEKYGLEIDLCPGCKGVWLDRGKLETILSQAAPQPVAAASSIASDVPVPIGREAAPVVLPPAYRHDEHDDHDHDDHDDHRGQRDHQTEHQQNGRNPKRRSSLLGDLLGVFGGED